MMKNILLAITIALFSFSSFAVLPKGVVAMVNGQPITQYQLDNRTKLIINTQNMTFNNAKERADFDRQTIDELVEEALIRKAGRDFDIEVSDKMIIDSIANMEKQFKLPKNHMIPLLEEHGLSVDSYKDRIATEIIKSKIFSSIGSDVTVSEGEAKEALLSTKGVKPIVNIWQFTSTENSDKEAYSQLENLRKQLIKLDINKLPNYITGGAEQVNLTDYAKLSPRTKSAFQDTNKGNISKIYFENGKYKLIAVIEKDFTDEKKITAVKNNLRMNKAEKKYILFIKGLRNKADIVTK